LDSSPLTWSELSLLPGADVSYAPRALAADWFAKLRDEIPWEQHRLKIFGREIDAPRMSCWVGDAEAAYTYSQTRFEPRAWTPALSELRAWLVSTTGNSFNSVLCNLYRGGSDSMGWHSDDEPELGTEPVIASLSFGAARRFRLRHKRDARWRLELDLEPGSLLLMRGGTQRHYKHDLPKTARAVGERINLTFRLILAEGARK